MTPKLLHLGFRKYVREADGALRTGINGNVYSDDVSLVNHFTRS